MWCEGKALFLGWGTGKCKCPGVEINLAWTKSAKRPGGSGGENWNAVGGDKVRDPVGQTTECFECFSRT